MFTEEQLSSQSPFLRAFGARPWQPVCLALVTNMLSVLANMPTPGESGIRRPGPPVFTEKEAAGIVLVAYLRMQGRLPS